MPSWKRVVVSGSDATLNSLNVATNVVAQSFTGSLQGTASYAINADFLDGKDSSVFATTGSNIFVGNQTVTGSLFTTGSNTLIGVTSLTGSLNISGSETITGYIQFEPVVTNINTAISASYIYVSGSTNDLYFSQNSKGYSNTTRLRWLEGNLYTGLLHGGLITTQSSTVYQVSSGSGIIVDLNASLSDDPYPTIQYLNWGNLSASIAPFTASFQQAFIGIDSTNNIFAQGTPFSNGQFDTVINIGNVLFQNQSTINGVKTQPSVAYGFEQQQNTFNRAFGPLKLSGYTLAPSGSSTGSLIVASGTAYAPGSNYTIDPNDPSYTIDPGTNVSKIFRYHQSGSTWVYNTNGGPGFATIDPTKYSNNGVLTNVGGGNWTIQRCFYFPNSVTKAIVVYYGNARYGTEAEARGNIDFESFVEAPNTSANAIYLGAIIINGTGVFTSPGDFTIYPGGLFRQVGGSGGGGSIVTQTLAGLSDVLISGPTDGQALVYDNMAAKWENKSSISASITGNAATSTSASFATTASYVLNAVSSSFATNALSSSFATNALSSSFAASATSASYAVSASHVIGGVNPFPYTGSAIISGSLAVTGSVGFAYEISTPEAWSASTTLSTARAGLAGAGTQNSALAFGGNGEVSCTEEYDGSTWAAAGALITARRCLAGAGTQNAGLAFGGGTYTALSCTEEYNGTSWSSGGALINARDRIAGAGTQNEALAFGGNNFGVRSCTEEYDGSTWSTGGALITARRSLAGAGTQNAGLAFGGYPGSSPSFSCTEEYNGTSWTAGGALSIARYFLAGAGTQNAALAFGGGSSLGACTEKYDGTSWSAGSALITGRATLAGAGTQNAGLAFGGGFPAGACTEEYTGASSTSTKTFDYSSTTGNLSATGSFTGSFKGDGSGLTGIVSNPFPYTGSALITGSLAVTGSVGFAYEAVSSAAWSAGGALSTARCSLAGAGTQNEGLAFGGSSPTTVSCTEEYNGSSWSSGGALITARFYLAGAGTQNAGLAFGGDPGYLSCTEEYDGSTWTAGGALITARRQLAGTGTQNAGLTFGGYNYPLFGGDCTEEYNGTSWSTGGALSVGRYLLAGAGTQNAGLAFGGIGGYACTEEYNGTSWSVGGALITSRAALAGSGTQNAGLAFGGNIPTVSCTEEYNGTSWTAGGALIIARDNLAGAGIQTAGLAFGGFSPLGIVSCTEEYSQGIVTTKTFNYSSTTGNLTATGSFTGSFKGDGSQLTGIATNAFPYTGSAIISGSLVVTGSFAVITGSVVELQVTSTGVTLGNALTDAHKVTGSLGVTGSFTVTTTGTELQVTNTGVNLGNISTDIHNVTGSLRVSGSLATTGSVGFTYEGNIPSAWSVGGALITARQVLAGAGTQNAGLAFGGSAPSFEASTEEYNGSSWAAGGALSSARYRLAGTGTQNEALAFGGGFGSSCTEEYNGTSWASGGNLITARRGLAGAGTQNVGLAFGGDGGTNCTEEYNGSAWSSGGALITALFGLAGAGTQNAGLAFGGSPVLACTEEYNGSSWTAGGALITARCGLAGAGTQNAGLAFGGRTPSAVACTEKYNGTSWSTSGGALITGRFGLAGAGTQTSALAFGGSSPAISSCTEEYEDGGYFITKTFDYSSTTGVTTVSCLIETSAERYKSNIQPLGSQLSNIMNLQPVEFDWKSNNKHDIGFVADSVKEVYPNLVSTNAQGEVEGMNYSKLVSALVKSIQEQQIQINTLTTEVEKLKAIN
jgi:hypothetical protein